VPTSILWPERESLYDLMVLRATIGHAAFESEKQNNPVDPELCEWPPEYFDHAAFWFDQWPDKLIVKTIGIDPSKGRDAKQGDYSAIVLFGVTAAGVEYVEADLARRPVDKICADAATLAAAFQPDGLVLEATAFQELMAPPLKAALEAAGARTMVYPEEDVAPKAVRIRRLTEPLCQRRVRFKRRSPGTVLLVQQARDFAYGDHDDGLDAWEKAQRLAIELLNGRHRLRGPDRLRA
jgi:hypothetical protein